jgi:hypothetical protein
MIRGGYSTEMEKEFIDNLGTQSEAGRRTPLKQLLQNYLRALELRQRWRGLEALEIRAHAERRLGVRQ